MTFLIKMFIKVSVKINYKWLKSILALKVKKINSAFLTLN